MEKLLGVLYQNIQWIFSGIGVTLLGLFLGKKATSSLKNKQTAKKQGINIATGNDLISDNLQTQTTGNNSSSIQVGGDYISGLTYQDARDVALDVFKANAQTLTDSAIQTINTRVTDITNDLFKMIYTDIPETVEKLIEPAVQEAILHTQKAYAKNDSIILKQQLIELMKQRLQVNENNIEQIILDEALAIIPKLNNMHMDILSLHFSVLQLRRANLNNRINFYAMIKNDILPFYFDEYASANLYAHLQYTGCTTILSEGSTYKAPEEIYQNNYVGLFNKGFTKEEFDNFMEFDTTQLQQIIVQCLIDPAKFQIDALNLATLENQIGKYHFEQYKDKLVQFYNQTSMTAQEIKEDIIHNYPQFKSLTESWSTSRTFKSLSLTSVGLAIGILNYNIKTGQTISLKDYL